MYKYLPIALVSGIFAQAADAELGDAEIALIYDSKYVTQGRDNLGEGGMSSIEGIFDLSGGASAGFWYTDADDVDYNETNFFIEYGFEVASLETYVGYNHLRFDEGGDKSSDNEYGFGVATTTLPLVLAADYVYSAGSNGGFVELSVSNDYEIGGEITVAPYALIGVDFGYSSESYDGENNYQVGVAAEKPFSETLTLSGYLAHSLAGEDVDRDGGGDETWGGIALTVSF